MNLDLNISFNSFAYGWQKNAHIPHVDELSTFFKILKLTMNAHIIIPLYCDVHAQPYKMRERIMIGRNNSSLQWMRTIWIPYSTQAHPTFIPLD